MKSFHLTVAVMFCWGLSTNARAVPLIHFDESATSSQGGGQTISATGDAYNVPYSVSNNVLLSNYTQPGGAHDWGNDAVGFAIENNVSSSADAFVTVDGDGTNVVRVRFSADALLDTSPPVPGYSGQANGRVLYSLIFSIDGLTGGHEYSLGNVWNTDMGAGVGSGSGGVSVVGAMSGVVEGEIGLPPAIFSKFANTSIVGHLLDNGSGSVEFIAPGAQANFVVNLNSDVFASFSSFDNIDDFAGGTFYGEATFTLLPEPSTLAILAIGASLFIPVGIRARRRAVAGGTR